MTVRANFGWGLLGGLTLAISGCATPSASVKLPPIVMAPPPPPMPPPVMPAGGFIGMNSPRKRADGRYFTPNLDNTDQAAVWHLRNALNVAALGCDEAGGGVLEHYNAWIRTRAAVIDRHYQAYIREWQAPGWWDWQRVYDDNQTRIYNFYAQPAIRKAFCAVARVEVAQVGQVADEDLPAFARASLLRLDQPFIDFFAAYDAWRDYYFPAPPLVVPPSVAGTDVPVAVTPPAVVATLGDRDTVAGNAETVAGDAGAVVVDANANANAVVADAGAVVADANTAATDTNAVVVEADASPAVAPGDVPIPAVPPPQ